MINSHWKILQCCLFWVGLIRRMWPYSDTNHFTFPLYRNGGPSLAIKVSPARCHCWVPTPQGRCSWCLGCQWAQSSETQLQSLSGPGGPREALKPGEQSNKDALMKAYEAKEMAPEMRLSMMDMAHKYGEHSVAYFLLWSQNMISTAEL